MATSLVDTAKDEVAAQQEVATDVANKLWQWAELGYLEEKSSALMQSHLGEHGFTITTGIGGLPTAFVASFGDSGPVIGLLAEMDALPGMGQAASPVKDSDGYHNGHACGHNLFAGGAVAAAISIKNWLEETGTPGQVRLYATPAEEGGSGKVYLARAGVFNDVDVVLHWHPSSSNSATPYSTLANKSAKFRFHGVASHAAIAPEAGRSALDGVEAMNYMANMMREHMPEKARMHYVISNGGKAPNIVPDFAEVYYYVRAPKAATVIDLWRRLTNIAEGAAKGTGTQVDWEVVGGAWNILPNVTLAKVMDDALHKVGGIEYSAAEIAFGNKIEPTLRRPDPEFASKGQDIRPFVNTIEQSSASTDVGDVSWSVPTAGVSTATWFSGVGAHSWQASAMSGMSVGHKGMMKAAEVMTLSAMALYQDPELIQQAKVEFEQRKGEQEYKALVGDREAPLDYRK
jgi:aminobenzoyl-glutamate utilization protein B